MTITKRQQDKLKRLSDRVRKLRHDSDWQYKVRICLLPAWNTLPGTVTITACKPELFERLQRMVSRIVPDAVFRNFEHGFGWHYLDRSPYYYAELNFSIKR